MDALLKVFVRHKHGTPVFVGLFDHGAETLSKFHSEWLIMGRVREFW